MRVKLEYDAFAMMLNPHFNFSIPGLHYFSSYFFSSATSSVNFKLRKVRIWVEEYYFCKICILDLLFKSWFELFIELYV